MDEAISKRIIISGLTPAITAKDLSDRLKAFGTVTSVEGFGQLDAVGQPRKFSYATLETTKLKLARCMNLLSGVTWKGAKLRLGEAKPDFRDRIAQELEKLKRAAEATAEELHTKRRRLPHGVHGVHALDMSLITPENVSTRGGWRVTPTGRLIRPMRMRPAHPLPSPLAASKPDKGKGKTADKAKSTKKRPRSPPARARRKTIDPTKWGSQHLKGIYLENVAVTAPQRFEVTAGDVLHEEIANKDTAAHGNNDSSENESELSDEEEDAVNDVPVTTPSPVAIASTSRSNLPPANTESNFPSSSVALDLAAEQKHSLGLLQTLFGDKQRWGGSESVGSDIKIDDDALRDEVNQAMPVPEHEVAMEVDAPEERSSADDHVPPHADSSITKLKDLFAPREEDAGFSLFGHLDLDLELEDDVPFDIPAPSFISNAAPSRHHVPILHSTSHITSLDPSRPFFFPSEIKGRSFDPANWRRWFYRTDSADAINTRWEEKRGELTAGWKRRHREAIKSRRRRGGAGAEVE